MPWSLAIGGWRGSHGVIAINGGDLAVCAHNSGFVGLHGLALWLTEGLVLLVMLSGLLVVLWVPLLGVEAVG